MVDDFIFGKEGFTKSSNSIAERKFSCDEIQVNTLTISLVLVYTILDVLVTVSYVLNSKINISNF
jgi:hypothetical protein